MLDLSRDLEDEAARFVRSLRRERAQEDPKVNAVLKDKYGDVRKVMGGMFNASINGRDSFLSVHGLTRADITAFREHVQKRLGFAPPVPMAEALLIQTDNSPEAIVTSDQEKRRKRERDKKTKRRQWAREHGRCIICCANAVSYTSEGKDMATCKECRERVIANRKKG